MTIINSLTGVQKVLKEGRIKIFCIGGLPSSRGEIWPCINKKDIEVICSNKTGELKSAKKKVKVKYFPLKRTTSYANKSPLALLSNPQVQKYIIKKSNNKKTAIAIFKPNQKIENICKENRWILLTEKHEIYEKLNDREKAYKIFAKIGCERKIYKVSLEELEQKIDEVFFNLGERIVIQIIAKDINIEGGKGTLFFNKDDRNNIIRDIKKRLSYLNCQKVTFIINKFIEGAPVSAIGCVTKNNGILSSYLRYLLIDISEVTHAKDDAKGIFCGNDWSLANNIPLNVNQEAERIMKETGLELKEEGFSGLFGIDFIWDYENNKLIPLEINPRVPGSFPTASYVQLLKQEVPLAVFNLLEFLDIPYKLKNEEVYKKDLKRQGAHLILFNPYSQNVICKNKLKGGVYVLNKDRLQFLRLGIEITDIKEGNEFILTSGVPVKNMAIAKNRQVLRILTKKTLTQNYGKELNDWGRKVVMAVYRELNLRPVQF